MPTLDEIMRIEGMTLPAETALLMRLAGEVAPPLTIVEIGTWRGRTAIALATGAQAGAGATVCSVDSYEDYMVDVPGGTFRYTPDSRDHARVNVMRVGLAEAITFVDGDALDVAATWTQPIGLLFVDARHDDDHALQHARAWAAHVADGGRLLLHDKDEPGVVEAADWLLAHGFVYEDAVQWTAVLRKAEVSEPKAAPARKTKRKAAT